MSSPALGTPSRRVPSLLVPSLRGYRSAWLPKDLVAGLVLSALLVPQGMAYAELAGLPPVTGLYTSMLCLVGYAVIGPSKILVLGPDSALGPMIAATILPLLGAGGDPVRAVLLASALAIMTGVLMVTAGIGRLGFVADLLSKPTIIGYMNGLALTIIVGQIPKLLGFSVDSDSFLGDVSGAWQGIVNGEVVPAAAAVGTLTLVVILLLTRWLPKVPAVLVAVVLAIAISVAFDLQAKGVKVIGTLPEGLPSFTIPIVSFQDLALLLAGAMGISLVALADTISTATSFAERQDEEVDGDREMIGIGTSNIAAGLFQGFPVSTSASRTAVAEQAGARTQLTGLVGAGMIALMLVFLPSLLADLPQPALGAIVIAAALALADIRGTARLFRQRQAEFWLSIAAFLGVAFLGVLPGILIAVALSVGNVFRRIWRPYHALLGRVDDLPGLHDITSYPHAEVLPGCPVFRFDAPLIFANAGTFSEEIRRLAATDPRPEWIVIAAEPMTDVDTTACDMLEDLVPALDEQGVRLVFAEMKDPTRKKVEAYGLHKVLGPDRFHPTIKAAYTVYQEQSGQDWTAR
jgi:high affinity sulfate transporter 1